MAKTTQTQCLRGFCYAGVAQPPIRACPAKVINPLKNQGVNDIIMMKRETKCTV